MPDDPMTARIGAAVGKIVRAVNLTPAPTAVVFRKRPLLLDGDALPLVAVAVGGGEEFEPLGVAGPNRYRWRVTRPVTLALAFASGGRAADNPDLKAWRHALWGAVTQRALDRAGVPEADDVAPRGEPVFDPAALAGSTADWSLVTLTVATLEDRADG